MGRCRRQIEVPALGLGGKYRSSASSHQPGPSRNHNAKWTEEQRVEPIEGLQFPPYAIQHAESLQKLA